MKTFLAPKFKVIRDETRCIQCQVCTGEYMAGGVLALLGINLEGGRYKASFIGTGMHDGVIYYRGIIKKQQLGKEVGTAELNNDDAALLAHLAGEFVAHFNCDAQEILRGKFMKLYPKYLRPYGTLYTY